MDVLVLGRMLELDAILAWRLGDTTEMKAGLTPEHERRLIAAWQEGVNGPPRNR